MSHVVSTFHQVLFFRTMNNRREIENLLIAPIIAPAVWFITSLLTVSLRGRLSMLAAGWQLIFFVLLLIASYAASLPALIAMRSIVRSRPLKPFQVWGIAIAVALIAGFTLSSPQFLEATRKVQGVIVVLVGTLVNVAGYLLINSRIFFVPRDVGAISERLSTKILVLINSKNMGVASLFCGVTALILAAVTSYADASSLHMGNWFILEWIDGYRKSENRLLQPVELISSSVFDLNERNAVIWICSATIIFTLYAFTAAVVDELRKQDSLYRSIGFICAAVAITLIHPLAGVFSLLIGGCVFFIARNKYFSFRFGPPPIGK